MKPAFYEAVAAFVELNSGDRMNNNAYMLSCKEKLYEVVNELVALLAKRSGKLGRKARGRPVHANGTALSPYNESVLIPSQDASTQYSSNQKEFLRNLIVHLDKNYR